MTRCRCQVWFAAICRTAFVFLGGVYYASACLAQSHSREEAGAASPKLFGVALGPNEAVALVRSELKGGSVLLHVGEAVDGWIVTAISARDVALLSHAGEQRVIALEPNHTQTTMKNGTSGIAHGAIAAADPQFDGLAAARRLALPAANIPIGSPLVRYR